jgi:hypothetical protein
MGRDRVALVTGPSDMTEEEGKRLIELEREVDKAMRSAGRICGAALAEIKDRRLYRASHASFEGYCIDRLDISRSAAYRMIEVAKTGSPNGLPPAVNAIAQASAQAAQRRHTTLDQPPTELDPEPEVLEPTPVKPKPEPRLTPESPFPMPGSEKRGAKPVPDGDRANRLRARDWWNRMMQVLDVADDDMLALVSTEFERIRISNLHATLVKSQQRAEETIDPATCPHPANRRIGDMCGRCGAKKAKR